MDNELTAKWHELDKVRVGLKDVAVLRPDLSAIQAQIGDLADLTTDAKDTLVAAINEAARSGGGGSGSMDLSAVDVYIADYQSAAELAVTAGAVDRYARLVVT